jgi:peptide/nickel transport system substrate-binding protein
LQPWLTTDASSARATIRVAITGFNVLNTLDPGKASLIQEYFVIWGMFNGLLKFSSNMDVVPDLAAEYKSVDSRTFEFKLRSNIKFHDGGELTSDDVKFTFDRLLDEKFASPYRTKLSVIEAVTIVDPLTVRIGTKEPFAPLLTLLCNFRNGTQIVPRRAIESPTPDDFGRKPIGTGAYMLKDWLPTQRLVLSANPNYFVSGLPLTPTIEVSLIAEESSGETAILGGQVDLTSGAPFAYVPNLEKRPEIVVLKQPGLNNRFIALNNRKPPFDDVNFRRALSTAFDRDAMVKAVLFGEGVAAQGLIPPTLVFAFESKRNELATFDPGRAQAELKRSKYGAGTTAAVLTWGSTWWKRAAEVFVFQVNQTLAINLTVEVSESNTVYSRLRSGEFQAAIWGWLGVIDPDDLFDIFHTTGWRNFQGYTNPQVDAALSRARAKLDRSKRGELYKRIETQLIEEMPVIPCFFSNIHNLLRKDVKGFTQLPYSNFGDQFATLEGE